MFKSFGLTNNEVGVFETISIVTVNFDTVITQICQCIFKQISFRRVMRLTC